MAAPPKLLPFKAKVEERTKIEGKDGASNPAPSAKKPCTAYDKQIQSMDGDLTLLKDTLGSKKNPKHSKQYKTVFGYS